MAVKPRNIQNICLHCFHDLDSNGVCLSCGRRRADAAAPLHHLPTRTLLHKRYLIVRALGEGGFGITYLAWDMREQMKVAVKEYYPGNQVTRDPKTLHMLVKKRQNYAGLSLGLEQFIDEAKTLSRLNTLKGIVSVSDFFPANNTAYLVMEYLDGVSLKRYLQKKGRLSANTILTILRPVLYSLKEVHALGLIHRDISPDNIIITRGNEVKLIDFGAAKQLTGALNVESTQNLSVILKHGFAPEEQYRRHGEQGPWTDIYALGVTIYYCMTLTLPPESVQRLYEDTLVPPRKLGAKITAAQEKILLKALAVRKADRYQELDVLLRAFYLGRDDDIESTLDPAADKPAPIDEPAAPELPYFESELDEPAGLFAFRADYELQGSGIEEAAFHDMTMRRSVTVLPAMPLKQFQREQVDEAELLQVDEMRLPTPREKLLSALKHAVISFPAVSAKGVRLLANGTKRAAKGLGAAIQAVKQDLAAKRSKKNPPDTKPPSDDTMPSDD